MINTANTLFQANYSYRSQQIGNISLAQGASSDSEGFNWEGIDQVHLSYSVEAALTYNYAGQTNNLPDATELLRGLVMEVFDTQALSTRITTDTGEVDLETLSPEEAQELIAEDGYFGVEKTSDRIFSLAIGIAGGDPSRIDAIRAGVEQGFQEALDAFGGWLPEISYDTYDAVFAKLDKWVAEA